MLSKANSNAFPILRNAKVETEFHSLVKSSASTEYRYRTRKAAIADLAAIALHTKTSPLEYWTLAQRLLQEKWDKRLYETETLSAFAMCLTVVRASANPAERLHGPDIFAQYLLENGMFEVMEVWAEIGRRIISALHTWPIIILETRSANAGYAVPVLVSVEYDGLRKCECEGIDGLKRFDWGSALIKARQVAEFFWANQHNRLSDHKNRTTEASILLDVSPTTSILNSVSSSLASDADDDVNELLGRSLEGCLVVALMNRFLGNRSSPNYAVCGQIGGGITFDGDDSSESEGESITNWRFEPVDGMDEKLVWATEASDFHTAIVPVGGNLPNSTAQNSSTRLEMCKTLLHVVDSVFGVNWRREKYFRCPDVAYARNRTRILDAVSSKFKEQLVQRRDETKKWLLSQSTPIAWAPPNIGALDLLMATQSLNDVDRLSAAAAPFPKRSITFIRIFEEQAATFASLLCDVCGASEAQTARLLHASDVEAAHEAFASIVGNIDGGFGTRAERFPDLLIILAEKGEVSDAFSKNPLRIEHLLSNECAKKIADATAHRSFDKAVQAWERIAGKARVIIASPEFPAEYFSEFSAPSGNDEIWDTINYLSIAGPVLDEKVLVDLLEDCGHEHDQRSEVISRLLKINFLFRSFAGYVVNPKFDPAKPFAQYWTAHRTAARSLVPILSSNSESHVHGQGRFSAPTITTSARYILTAKSYLERGRVNDVIETNEARRQIQILEYDQSLLTALQPKDWVSLDYSYKNRGNFSNRELRSLAQLGINWCLNHKIPEPGRLVGFISILMFTSSQIRKSNEMHLHQSLEELDHSVIAVLKHCHSREGKNPAQDIYFWSRANELHRNSNCSEEVNACFKSIGISDSEILKQVLSYEEKQKLFVDKAWATRIFDVNNRDVSKGSYIRSSIRRIFPLTRPFWIADIERAKGNKLNKFLWQDLNWSKLRWRDKRNVPIASMKALCQ